MSEKPTKFYSNKQEKIVAAALGGYKIGGSGAMPGSPGDVKTYDWLVECKTHTTPGKPIFFDINVWSKIKQEAAATYRKPVLVVDDGSQSEKKTWCLCKSSDLNLASMISVSFPVTIRKNISVKHDKLAEALKSSERYLGEFYKGGVLEVSWDGEDVCVLPLSLFKEIFEQ